MPPRVIQANYDILEQVARYFDQSEGAISHLHSSVAEYTQRVQGGGWTGLGASQFVFEMDNTVLPALGRLQNALSQSHWAITHLIKIFIEAEREAAALFHGNGNGATTGENPYAALPQKQGDGNPPLATEEQLQALEDLGIVLADGEQITQEEAQYLIDYANGCQGLIIADATNSPWTAEQLRQAIAILEKLDQLNMNFGQSRYVPGSWTLAELQHIDGVINTMADNARAEFLERYSQEDLIRLAAYYGLPPEMAEYAPFLLATEGRDISLARDDNNTVDYILKDGDLQYYPEGTVDPMGIDVSEQPVVYYSYVDADGTRQPLDISQQSVPDGASGWQEIVWQGRADGDAIVFCDAAFFAGTSSNFTTGGTFSADALVAHEVSHLIVFGGPDLANNFANLSGQGEGGINLTTTDTTGYINNVRTGIYGDEPVADLVTNGLMDSFTDTPAGRVRAAQFDQIIGDVFTDNYPEIPADFTVSDEYTAAATEALGD